MVLPPHRVHSVAQAWYCRRIWPILLHRRGIVFAHRDFDRIARAQHDGEKYGVLTGLMPSGKMHLGHKMVIDQVKWFQENVLERFDGKMVLLCAR